MSEELHRNQALLFCVGVHRSPFPILAALGDGALREASDLGNMEDCMPGLLPEDLPEAPGLYVWEGHLRVCWDTGEMDTHWFGETRPARLADLRRFGMSGAEFTFPILDTETR